MSQVEIEGRYESLTNEEVLAQTFVDVVKAKQDLEDYKRDPAPAEAGKNDSIMLRSWEKTVEGMESTFAEIVKSRYPEGDAVQ